MARKSKKQKDAAVSAEKMAMKTAIYTRLSIKDIRDRKDSTALETQRKMLENFVNENPDLALTACYTDNGETGMHFKRPGFTKLMEDISRGLVECLVVKDLSRLGRNHIDAGNYIENVFPSYGLRFISVNDRYDSEDPNCGNDILLVALKNLMNEIYALDISRKSMSALEVKQREGKFIGAYAAYGYLKSPDDKNKIIVDEETAPIVRDIFKWKLEGMSLVAITRRLNELKIPSPSSYRYSKGIIKDERLSKCVWQIMTVKNILRHPVYLGHMAQGQKKSGVRFGVRQTRIPQTNWVIVENTHEAIIEQSVFDEVQKLIAGQTAIYNSNKGKYAHLGNPENVLKGLAYCPKCGRKLVRYKNVTKKGTKVHYTFICPSHAAHLEQGCSFNETIHEEILLDTILKVVINELNVANEAVETIKKLNGNQKTQSRLEAIESETVQINKELERKIVLKNSLFENFADGIIDERDYEFAIKKYTREIDGMRQRLEKFSEEKQKFSDDFAMANKWVNLFQGLKGEPVLTKRLLNTLIAKIIVHNEKFIEITFNYDDEREALLRHIAEHSLEQEGLS